MTAFSEIYVSRDMVGYEFRTQLKKDLGFLVLYIELTMSWFMNSEI